MAEEMTTPNVMSVEVAIKRELEYRRKMEALQFQLQDSQRAAIPSQEPPLNVLGIKRKAPASNLQSFPPPQPRPSCSRQPFQNRPVSLVCQACQETFSSVVCLKKHCEGPKHKFNLIRMKINHVSNPLWCKLCKVSCSSVNTLEQHLIGKKHGACLQGMEDAKTAREEKSEVANINWEKLEWEMVS
ncbi:hypothetical protein L1049_005854 [Liquidambar formosana]|uniref:C2H2-type domain-containing protein n=1 Tax=Liquidambar formosana TaxID=63359 RepID=A0AAP0WSH0_LIQFO